MSEGAGGWLWIMITVGMVAVLGVALAYAALRGRNKRLDPVRDEATRRVYRQDSEVKEDQRGA